MSDISKLGEVKYQFVRHGRVRTTSCDTIAEALMFADYDHEDGSAAFEGIYIGGTLWVDHGTWLSGLINHRSLSV